MRSSLPIAVLLAITCLVGCGEGLRNAPLRVGWIKGSVPGGFPGTSEVFILGQPQLRTLLDEQLAFELAEVPAGPVEVIVLASSSQALTVATEVRGGRSSDLGALELRPAAFLEVRVRASGGSRVPDAQLTVVGTPYAGLPVSSEGRARIGPLPAACYTLAVHSPAEGDRELPVCLLEGQELQAEVEFEGSSFGAGGTGCEATGCAAGLSCVGSVCVGQLAACGTCASDVECGPAARCESQGGSSRVCVGLCDASTPCSTPGTSCQSDRCVPDPTHLRGCGAYLSVGLSCAEDDTCRQAGMEDGVCVAGACTYACAFDAECPEHARCETAGTGRYCRSR